MKYFTPIIKINSQLTCNIYIKRDDLLLFLLVVIKLELQKSFLQI